MPTIQISELRPAGFGLFQDDETFLNELGEKESSMISGGAIEVWNFYFDGKDTSKAISLLSKLFSKLYPDPSAHSGGYE